MSKWIYTHEDGERVVVDLTDEEAAALMAAQKEDEGDDDPEPSSPPTRVQDTPEEFARVEAVYRKERAAIRASRDAEDLVMRRVSLERVLRDTRQSNIAHTRAHDLLGEVEQRELNLRAERLANGRR